MQKKHGGKCRAADHIYFAGFLAGMDRRHTPQQHPGNTPAHQSAKGVGHQIVDIRSPECEDLQNLNQQGGAESKQNRFIKFLEMLPKEREKKTQRHEKQHIQETVCKVGEHIGKGNEVEMGLETDIADIRQSHHREHGR